jgi:hypothetical protein
MTRYWSPSKRLTGMVLSLVLLVGATGCGSAADTGTSTTPASAPTHTATPTIAAGTAVLGGLAAAFEAKYGQPNDHSDAGAGRLNFARYANSNVDKVIIQLDMADGGALSQHVELIIFAAPDG